MPRAADSATVIVGTVYDDSLEDQLRETIVLTGLGIPIAKIQAQAESIKSNAAADRNQQPVDRYELQRAGVAAGEALAVLAIDRTS